MQDDMTLGKYMRAFELPSVGKTRYCFQPMPDTVFNGECLGEIIQFLRDLNKEHREGLRRRAAARHHPERV